jgi:DHA1 family bicyclomycin/chloramphenicol resistance-like MFS transporter
MYLLLVLVIGTWFSWRQPETLTPDRRIPFSLMRIAGAIREVITHHTAFGYIVTIGLVSGAFIGYLNSAQQVFQQEYGLGRLFPLYFVIRAFSWSSTPGTFTRAILKL